MATSNLNLDIIDSSEFVSPEKINNNTQKLDALGKDYITDSGKSGEWWFRKYKSGRMECGIDCKQFPDTPMPESIANGAMWRSSYLRFGAYPFAFSAPPFYTITFIKSIDQGRMALPVVETGASNTQSPVFRIWDINGSVFKGPCFGIFVSGTI